jgi:glycosyltransferase involved in cell wall biosynthesis
MIKVAFWYDRPQAYSGGLNYMRNLLFALSELQSRKIQPYIFFGKHVDESVVRSFEPYATLVRTSLLDRMSPLWFLDRILRRVFGSLLLVHLVLRRHDIAVVSHSEHIQGGSRFFKVISWIPDFQYLHLPELFPNLDAEAETSKLRQLAKSSDALVLSSYSALNDFRSIAPVEASDAIVLQFVSQPSGILETWSGFENLPKKYNFSGRFFFLPNQFWQHKNHSVVFSAINLLKKQGLDVQLLCTGNIRDYRTRDNKYVDGLINFVKDNELEGHIKILGMIEYDEVLQLMRNSVAVINPSRFEGWSSTVEEARSMGKRLILSDIPVHREQNPRTAVFFPPEDVSSLAQAMMTLWSSPNEVVSREDQKLAAEDLRARTLTYGEAYERIVTSLVQ